jgi:hypothetical protein
MLSKKQQIKLILLTAHPKYGQLLADAIESWKQYPINQFEFGIIYRESGDSFELQNPEIGCCLAGAALISKKPGESRALGRNLANIFDIDDRDVWSLISGFEADDFRYCKSYYDIEGLEFGKKVRKILFENS